MSTCQSWTTFLLKVGDRDAEAWMMGQDEQTNAVTISRPLGVNCFTVSLTCIILSLWLVITLYLGLPTQMENPGETIVFTTERHFNARVYDQLELILGEPKELPTRDMLSNSDESPRFKFSPVAYFRPGAKPGTALKRSSRSVLKRI